MASHSFTNKPSSDVRNMNHPQPYRLAQEFPVRSGSISSRIIPQVPHQPASVSRQGSGIVSKTASPPTSMDHHFFGPGGAIAPWNEESWGYPSMSRGLGYMSSSATRAVDGFVAEMRTRSPGLCASLDSNFDINTVFDPELIAVHGETFLRLAASQIALDNQSKEIAKARMRLTDHQCQLKGMELMELHKVVMSQESELRNHKMLVLELRDLTISGVAAARQKSSAFVPPKIVKLPPQDVTNAFYRRSVGMPPLVLNQISAPEVMTTEKHGYGHAETSGPVFTYDKNLPGEVRNPNTPKDQRDPLSPNISTAGIFTPSATSALIVHKNRNCEVKQPSNLICKPAVSGDARLSQPAPKVAPRLSTAGVSNANDNKQQAQTKAGQPKKADSVNHKQANPHSRAVSSTSQTSSQSTGGSVLGPQSGKSLKLNSVEVPSEGKSISYAAAVRKPSPPNSDISVSKPNQNPVTPTKSDANTTASPDFGFPLQPLPKPTGQQNPNSISNTQESTSGTVVIGQGQRKYVSGVAVSGHVRKPSPVVIPIGLKHTPTKSPAGAHTGSPRQVQKQSSAPTTPQKQTSPAGTASGVPLNKTPTTPVRAADAVQKPTPATNVNPGVVQNASSPHATQPAPTNSSAAAATVAHPNQVKKAMPTKATAPIAGLVVKHKYGQDNPRPISSGFAPKHAYAPRGSKRGGGRGPKSRVYTVRGYAIDQGPMAQNDQVDASTATPVNTPANTPGKVTDTATAADGTVSGSASAPGNALSRADDNTVWETGGPKVEKQQVEEWW